MSPRTAVLFVVAVLAFVVGAVAGCDRARYSIAEECAESGSFVVDEQRWTCSDRKPEVSG